MNYTILSHDPLEVAEKTVSWVDSNVQRVRWDNDQIREKFANRTVRQIVGDGDTCYMAPCLDLTLVAQERLKANEGYSTEFVIERVKQEGFGFDRLHFALNYQKGEKWYHIDFLGDNIVEVGDGRYSGNQREDVTAIARGVIAGSLFGPDRLCQKVLEKARSQDGNLDALVGDFDLAVQKEKIIGNNTLEEYEGWKKKLKTGGRTPSCFEIRPAF